MLFQLLLLGCSLVVINGQDPPWIRQLIGSSINGQEIIGGTGQFPSHGGAGAGHMHSNGIRNGWDGNPSGSGISGGGFGLDQHGVPFHQGPSQAGFPGQHGGVINSHAFGPYDIGIPGHFETHPKIGGHANINKLGPGPFKQPAKPILSPKKPVKSVRITTTYHVKPALGIKPPRRFPMKKRMPIKKPTFVRKPRIMRKNIVKRKNRFSKFRPARLVKKGPRKGFIGQKRKPFMRKRFGMQKRVYGRK